MEVNAIGPVASPTVRFSTTEHANKLAEANHAARIDKPVASSDAPAETAQNVPGTPAYSPALYAQAAHFQLLAQAGAFAVLHQATASKPEGGTPSVSAVKGVDGASVKSLK